MPHFLLHRRNGGYLIRDDQGVDLPDLACARAEATRALSGIVAKEGWCDRPTDVRAIEICNKAGHVLASVAYQNGIPNGGS